MKDEMLTFKMSIHAPVACKHVTYPYVFVGFYFVKMSLEETSERMKMTLTLSIHDVHNPN